MSFQSINSVVLSGYIGSDPEIRVLESGVKLARFSIATNETYIDNNGVQQTHTQWHQIVCWRTVASYAEFQIRRGSLVRLEGKLRSISPDIQRNSPKMAAYEIIAHTLQLLTNDALQVQSSSRDAQKSIPTHDTYSDSESRFDIDAAPQDVDGIPF